MTGTAGTPDPAPPRTYAYGPHPDQVCDLHLPAGPARGTAVLLHGGYWRARYDRSLQTAVVADLVARGWAVWNVEYRRVGTGGGWPATFEDVAAAVDLLAGVAVEQRLPAAPTVVVGHSAGGALALWAALRENLPDGAPGAGPRLVPTAVVAQAAVCDLAAGARAGLGAGAVEDLMGAPPDGAPQAYALASPAALVPLRVPVLLVTGGDDDTVPAVQSEDFAAWVALHGGAVTLAVVPAEGHYGHLEPASPVWRVTAEWLDRVALDRVAVDRPGVRPGAGAGDGTMGP